MARAEATITVKDMPEVTALIERLTERAETAEAAIERALAIWREHSESHCPAGSLCICVACEMGRALDGTAALG